MAAQEEVLQALDRSELLVVDLTSNAQASAQSASTSLLGAFNGNYPTSIASVNRPNYDAPSRPSFAGISPPSLEEFPKEDVEFQEIQPIKENDLGLGNAPDIDQVRFTRLDEPDRLDKFRKRVPNISTSFANIAVPNIREFGELDLIRVDLPEKDFAIQKPSFEVQAPTLPSIDTGFKAEWLSAYGDAEANVRACVESWADEQLARHHPEYQQQIAALDGHVRAVVEGEQAVWFGKVDRAILEQRTTRVEAERRRLDDELERNLVNRGAASELTLATARQRNDQAGHDASVAAAFAVAEQSRGREIQHLQVSLQLLNQRVSEGKATYFASIQAKIQMLDWALRYANSCVQTSIQAANLQIQLYNSELDGYRTAASVYETQLRAALVDLEIYERELAVARLESDINRARIQELEAQVRVEDQKIRLYVARLQGQAQELENRLIPLRVYEQEVRAYAAYVDGQSQAVSVYQAQLQGKRIEQDIETTKLEQYDRELRAARIRLDVQKEANQARIDSNRNLIDIQRFALDKFTARTGLDLNIQELDLQNNRSRVDQYRAEIAAEVAKFEAEAQNARLSGEINLEEYRTQTQVVLAANDRFLATQRARAEIYSSSARILADLAKSALNSSGGYAALINQTTQTG